MAKSFFDALYEMFSDFAERAGRLGVIGTAENLLHADEHQIDLAWTVLLVDMASIDNDFSPRESYFIKQKLKEHLGVGYDEAVALVERASKLVQSDKSLDGFGKYLRDHLSLSKRKELLAVMDELIDEDQVDHPFEADLRKRFIKRLGLSED